MSVSIIRRPEGVTLNQTDQSATVTNYFGDALLNCLSHGVTDGATVYVIGLSERYNGFWEADVIDTDTFRILDPETGEAIEFIKSINVTFNRQLFTHPWSCVHLPIVYKLSNTLFPYSQVDGVYDFVMYGFVNGFFAITDASIYGFGYASLQIGDYIALYNHTNLFEVLDLVGPNIIVLNWDGGSLADTTNTLDPSNTTYLIGIFQKYYNNYHIKIQIYAGLTDTHYWQAEKPYELISTINLVPDNDNKIMFSISEEIMTKIKTLTNNLTLDTLPNNIDAFTEFYITTQEIYDSGNGSGPSTISGSIVSDKANFEGVATNSKLEFKNIYSGFLSDYVINALGTEAKFLTLFTTPTIFDGHYFDLSYALDLSGGLTFVKQWIDSNGDVIITEEDAIVDNGLGIYRKQLTADCQYPFLNVFIKLQTEQLFLESYDWEDFTAGDPIPYNYNRSADSYAPNSVVLDGSATWATDDLIIVHTRMPLFLPRGSSMEDFQILFDVTVSSGSVRMSVTTDGSSYKVYSSAYGAGVHEDQILMVSGLTADIATATYLIVSLENENGTTGTVSFSDFLIPVGELAVSLDSVVTEDKLLAINCDCSGYEIELTWLNYLGGFEYWVFKAFTQHEVDIKESIQRTKNIFPEWPKSYGETANTIRQETKRTSTIKKLIRSQSVSADDVEALKYIKTSPLVQLINSQTDLRTVTIDTDSFVVRNDGDKLHYIQFYIEYTDDIPAQRL